MMEVVRLYSYLDIHFTLIFTLNFTISINEEASSLQNSLLHCK
ncbi:MAG: hypothetical protein JWN78_2616 [Bacteroidota bacterium]|nr:hypothetical protein [Bacteroidota bacterium]